MKNWLKNGPKSFPVPHESFLLVIVATLCSVGLVMIFSGSYEQAREYFDKPDYYLLRQLQWLVVGVASLTLFAVLDYRLLGRYSIYIMGSTILLLMMVLILGTDFMGARRTFGLAIQPSELAKLTITIYMAYWLSSKGDRLRNVSYGIAPFAVLLGLISSLLVLQPDFGSVAVVTATAVAMFFVAGADIKQMALAGGIALATFYLGVVRLQYASQRMFEYLASLQNPSLSSDPVGAYLAAIARGGVFGRGLFRSESYIPLPFTDGVVAVIGEELGLFGILVIVTLFVVLGSVIFRVAARTHNSFGLILACGIATWLSLEVFLSLATTTGILPYSGAMLPFLAYGGSSALSTLTAVGIVIGISRSLDAKGMRRESSTRSNITRSLVRGIGLVMIFTLIGIVLAGLSTDVLVNFNSTEIGTPEVLMTPPRALDAAVIIGRVLSIGVGMFLTVALVRMRRVRNASERADLSPHVIIERSLESSGQARKQELGSRGVYFLAQYHEEHKDYDLVLDRSGVLQYRNRDLWRYSSNAWQQIDEIALRSAYLPKEHASNLIGVLSRSLDVPVMPELMEHSAVYFTTLIDTAHLLSNIRLPRVLPVFVPEKPRLVENDLLVVPKLARDLCPDSLGIGILIDWSGQPVDAQLLGRLRQVYAFDVLVLDRTLLQQLAIFRYPQELFRKELIRSISLVSVTPFVATGPTPENMFFGRERELREITEHVSSVNYAVIGGRRIGKTSLLGRLHRIRLPAAGYMARYYDCTVQTELSQIVRSLSADEPSVLLLDEADKLVENDADEGWPFLGSLRALTAASHVKVVLCGERALQGALRDPRGPLFNFANEMILGPLDYRSVEELVILPMKQLGLELRGEREIAQRIYDFTSGHPNVVQRLCRRLVELLNERDTRCLRLEYVDEVVESPAFQRDDFLSTFWEAATPLEKIISLLMSRDESVRTLRTILATLEAECGLAPSAREVDEALQRLVDLRSILKRSPTGYEFGVTAFPRVVSGTMTLTDMLEILTEEYQE